MNSRATQLPEGRHIDTRDAVRVVDCEQNLSAAAYEPAFTAVAGKNETVESTGDDEAFADPSIVEVEKLKFGRAVAGSMQARFGEQNAMDHGSQGLSSILRGPRQRILYIIEVPVDGRRSEAESCSP